MGGNLSAGLECQSLELEGCDWIVHQATDQVISAIGFKRHGYQIVFCLCFVDFYLRALHSCWSQDCYKSNVVDPVQS